MDIGDVLLSEISYRWVVLPGHSEQDRETLCIFMNYLPHCFGGGQLIWSRVDWRPGRVLRDFVRALGHIGNDSKESKLCNEGEGQRVR
jgi:hypothetical protein